MPARKAAEYLKVIADAIQFAHEQGTLHRDLKPSNILVDQFDNPHVTDFGLAKRIEGDSDLTATGAVIGTPGYMPPEQVRANRDQIEPASDVYSLGAIFYELLTGRPPFQAESAMETLLQVLDNETVSPRILNRKVPRNVETICLKCLRKEPRHRYSAAAKLSDDLTRWLNGEAIHARPVGRIEKTWLWCKRKPATVISIGVVISLLLLIGLGIYFSQTAARPFVFELWDDSAWANVYRRNLDSDAYERVLQKAEAACIKNPDDSWYLTTLGVAQYRVRKYEDAIRTLERARQLDAGLHPPSNGPREPRFHVAFLAMAYHQVGRFEEALRLHDQFTRDLGVTKTEISMISRELEQLLNVEEQRGTTATQ